MKPPKLGDRSAFSDLGESLYFAHCAVSPPSAFVQGAVAEVLADYAAHGLGAWARWRDRREVLRADLAALVGASPEDLAFVPNTTAGVQAVALSRRWRAGDHVVCFEGEFPTNVTPWQAVSSTFGTTVELHSLEPFVESEERGLATLRQRLERGGVALVAVSLVQFQTGLRMPVEAMATLCHAHGAELFVDAIQGIGVLPFRVGEIDYVTAGGHKWLMGLEGAGFLYARRDRVQAFEPRVAGWLSHEDPVRFLFEGAGHLRYDRRIRARTDLLEGGAANVVGLAALGASVSLLRTLGVEAIDAHVRSLLDPLDEALRERGFRSARSSRIAARSAILAVRPPGPRPAQEWAKAAAQRGVSLSAPDGWLRIAPHWPNDRAQVDRLLGVLEEIRAEDLRR